MQTQELDSDDLRQILDQVRTQRVTHGMEIEIHDAWQHVANKYAVTYADAEPTVKNSQNQIIGVFGQHDISLKTLDQISGEQSVLHQVVAGRADQEIEVCLELEPKAYPWLYLINGTCSYGGKEHAQSLNAISSIVFRNGFCYMNLFIPLSQSVKRYNVKPFAKFIKNLPEVLGEFPSLIQILSTLLYVSKYFPELTYESIPVVGFSAESLQFHVVDARGLPSSWTFLHAQRVCDLIALLARWQDATFMLYPVGGVEKYAQWPPRLHHYSTNRFVEYGFLKDRLKFIIENDMSDEGRREAVISELMNMGMTNVVGSEKRFPSDSPTTPMLVHMHEEPFVGALSNLRNFLLSGHRGMDADGLNKEARNLAAGVLQCLSVTRSSSVPIYTRAVFEVKFKLVWDAQYLWLPMLKKEVRDLAIQLNAEAENIEELISKAHNQPFAPKEEEIEEPVEYETEMKPQQVEVVNMPQARSSFWDIVIGLTTTFLALTIGFLIRAYMRIQGWRFTLKKQPPWFIEPTQGRGGGDDDDEDQPPPPGRRPQDHPWERSISILTSDSRNQQESGTGALENINLLDEEIHYYDEDQKQMRKALEECDFRLIIQKRISWAAMLQQLHSHGVEGDPYAILADYLTALIAAHDALNQRGTMDQATYVALGAFEIQLRLAGITFGAETPMARLEQMYTSSPLHQWRTSLRNASLSLGKECLAALDELIEKIREDRANNEAVLDFDVLAAGAITAFRDALKELVENESVDARVKLISNAEGLLVNLNLILGSSYNFPIIDAFRRTHISEAVHARIPTVAASASGDQVDTLIQKEMEKLQSEISMNNAIAQSNRDIAAATQAATTRDHWVQPINTLANLSLAGGMIYGSRRMPIGSVGATSAPAAQTAQRSFMTGRGHRLTDRGPISRILRR